MTTVFLDTVGLLALRYVSIGMRHLPFEFSVALN